MILKILLLFFFLTLSLLAKNFNLSIEQQEYLKQKQEIKICVNPYRMPFEKIEKGIYIGIIAEYMEIISKVIKIPIKLVETLSWKESLEKIKNKECDILPMAEKKLDYINELLFSITYLKTPVVLATRIGTPFIYNFENIKHEKIGIKDYKMYNFLKNKYSNINLIKIDSVQNGLSQLEQEKLFAFIDNSIILNHEIQKRELLTIDISGQLPEFYEFSMATRNDEKILNEILNLAILSITKDTKNEILNKWNNIQYSVQTDYELIIKIVFFALIIISIFIYWNLRLKEEILRSQLKNSEEKFRTLFDIAPILLNSFDKDGRLNLWNKECEKVFGWKFEEIKNLDNHLKIFYPDDEIRKKVEESLISLDSNIFKEWSPITKYGNIIVTKWANIKLPDGEIINIGYDITQQKKDEILIKEKNNQLKITKDELESLNNFLEQKIEIEIEKNTKHQIMLMQQSKLAQMGEMIENIAHQWRQPLAQINSSVLLIDMVLNKNKFTNSIVENKLTEIETLTAYMSKTIDDFKNFFDPSKQKTIFKIEESIQKSNDILKGLLGTNHIELIAIIEENLECYGYLEELQQVILTILNNAIEALILMEITSPKILIKAYKEKEYIFISIEDNALGINNDFIDKIFEPYFTTKSKFQGTGLGLYMAKMIIENGLLGTLSVENKPNGACFTIKILEGKL